MIEQFHRPSSAAEALGLKREHRDKAVFLAGGTFVNAKDYPQGATHLISLDGLGLSGLRVSERELSIGALATFQSLVETTGVPAALRDASLALTNRNVRNAASVGGAVASAKACSDLVVALVALDAKVDMLTLEGAPRTLTVAEYANHRPEGLITQLRVPRAQHRKVAFRNFRESANAQSLFVCGVSLEDDDGHPKDLRIVFGGTNWALVRLAALEADLEGRPLPDLDDLQSLAARALKPGSCRATCIAPCLAALVAARDDDNPHLAAVTVALSIRDAMAAPGGPA